MIVVEPETARRSLLARVAAMLFRPDRTWEVIDAQPTGGRALFRTYVMPLAAIPAVCGLLGMLLFGYRIAGIGFRQTPVAAILEAVANFGLTLAAVYGLAVFIDWLAPTFGGLRDRTRALNLVGHAGTAVWVAGLFSLAPSIGILAGVLGALYSLYVLYLGLPKLMRTTREAALGYFALVLLAAVVLAMLRGALASRAAELGGPLRTAALAFNLA